MDDQKWLIAREMPHLRRYATALLRDPDAADDLVQDTVERAIRKRHLWRRHGTMRSWLFRMLYNLFVNGQRSARRAGIAVPVEDVEERLSERPAQEARVQCRDMAEALDQLPPEQRAVVLLIALEDVSYDEAAEILEVPIGTVRSRLSRGRETLREMWRPDARMDRLRRVK